MYSVSASILQDNNIGIQASVSVIETDLQTVQVLVLGMHSYLAQQRHVANMLKKQLANVAGCHG